MRTSIDSNARGDQDRRDQVQLQAIEAGQDESDRIEEKGIIRVEIERQLHGQYGRYGSQAAPECKQRQEKKAVSESVPGGAVRELVSQCRQDRLAVVEVDAAVVRPREVKPPDLCLPMHHHRRGRYEQRGKSREIEPAAGSRAGKGADALHDDEDRGQDAPFHLGSGGEGGGNAELCVPDAVGRPHQRRHRDDQRQGDHPVGSSRHVAAYARSGDGKRGQGERRLGHEADDTCLPQSLTAGQQQQAERAHGPQHHGPRREAAGQECGGGIEIRQQGGVVPGEHLVPRHRQEVVVGPARQEEPLSLQAPVKIEVGDHVT